MTKDEWERKAITLKSRITRAKNKLKSSNESLSIKLALKEKVKEAEEELWNHKLNYFELTNES